VRLRVFLDTRHLGRPYPSPNHTGGLRFDARPRLPNSPTRRPTDVGRGKNSTGRYPQRWPAPATSSGTVKKEHTPRCDCVSFLTLVISVVRIHHPITPATSASMPVRGSPGALLRGLSKSGGAKDSSGRYPQRWPAPATSSGTVKKEYTPGCSCVSFLTLAVPDVRIRHPTTPATSASIPVRGSPTALLRGLWMSGGAKTVRGDTPRGSSHRPHRAGLSRKSTPPGSLAFLS